jgi:DNA polymerase-3 subunit alpha
MSRFVHLHTHSEYSLLDGAARVKDLVARAVELEMPALAITDHGAMFGAVEFYKAAKAAGIKPIVGCEVYFTPGSRTNREGKQALYHLLLLAKDLTGYRNLMAMVSDAWVTGLYYKPRVDMELLTAYHEGLVCTSACMSGIVSKSFEQADPADARRWAETYASLFGEDFFIEVQDQGITSDNGVTQEQLNRELSALAGELGVGLVGTNDIHYVNAKDAAAQDMLLCIQTGSTVDATDRMRFSSDRFYMKTAEEMAEALAAYPEALDNTALVAERCDLELEFGKTILPVFDVPERITGATEEERLNKLLEEECRAGLTARYGDPPPAEAVERLDHELGVIEEKGFAGYFLVVQDFVAWAKANGIGVGPGRGSAAGSIIAYSLGITNLDPLEHGLLFERFLNTERTEMPDIDMDFDDERRGEVIAYVRDKYGSDKVAQIVTFNTMKARAAVRDAGRVLGYPYGVPDKIAKQIQEGPDASIAGSLKSNPDLRGDYEAGGDTRRILDAALALEGLVRGEGVHAAGVVICRDPLFWHTPVKRDTKGEFIVTQYEGTLIAELGLLKMDFLGLRNLTVLAKALVGIKANRDIEVDLEHIPMDDADTFALYQRADTDGVFQVESPGMKRVLLKLKPTTFADIVAVVALYRPGPMDNIDDFVARKHGRARITYYDDRIRHILEETYGAMVYQEQVMLIAMEMAGFTAAKADKIRKAMGKKDPEVMANLEQGFLEGAAAGGYEAALARQVWTDIEKFAGYAFNKSHAAAYALISYQTAYLKAHYPKEFMAAVLSSYTGKTENIVKYVAACNRGGIHVLPPDVNSSGKDFTAVPEGIRFGLAGIRNVGEGVVDMIIAARTEGGPFSSLTDFCNRVDLRLVNKRTLEALIKAGAFDSTGYTRKHLVTLMDGCVESGIKRRRDAEDGQISMFEMDDAADHGFEDAAPPPNADEWDKRIQLAFEKEMLGIYVSDHPLREISDLIRSASTLSLGDADELKDGTIGWFAGILTKVERVITRNGKQIVNYTLEDLDGAMEGGVFGPAYAKYEPLMAEDRIVRIRAKFEVSDRGRKLNTIEVQPLGTDGCFDTPPGVLGVTAPADVLGNGGAARLKEILGRYPGRDAVHVITVSGGERKKVRLPGVTVDKADGRLHAELKEWLGARAVWEE